MSNSDLLNHGLVGGINTSEATNPITAGDVLSPKVGFVNNQKIIGTLALTGTATATQVLNGASFYNTDAKVKEAGTMVNNGSVGTQNLTTEGQEYTIAQGYHNGLGKVKAVITGLIASVIKAGVTVGGIVGTFTSDANAIASQMLSGVTAYVNGNKITGTMPSKAEQTYTPSTADQTISAGQYLSGAQTILGDADLIASNILSGANIFNVAGTAKRRATGSGAGNGTVITISGLPFQPRVINFTYIDSSYRYNCYYNADYSATERWRVYGSGALNNLIVETMTRSASGFTMIAVPAGYAYSWECIE